MRERTVSKAKSNRLKQFMREYADRGYFNGSVLVCCKGEAIYREGYGMANYEFDIPNAPDTRYRIASLSKAFTAAAIRKLHDEGALHLDCDVQTYMPAFSHRGVTVRHLLSHRSGLDDRSFSLEYWQKTQKMFHTLEETLHCMY